MLTCGLFAILSLVMLVLGKLDMPGFEPIPHTNMLGIVFAFVAVVCLLDFLNNEPCEYLQAHI